MKKTARFWTMIKSIISVSVTIILIYPLLGIIASAIAYLNSTFNIGIPVSIIEFLTYPLLLPIRINKSRIIDIAPLLLLIAAGIWGWNSKKPNRKSEGMHENR